MLNNILNFINEPYKIDKLKINHLFIQDGGKFKSNFNFNIIIGFIFIIIGLLIIGYKYSFNKVYGNIISKEIGNNLQKVNFEYKVDDIIFNKIIVLPKTVILDDKIEIYYDNVNPNLIKLNNTNYNLIGTVLIIIGIFMSINFIIKND